jgi:hypothetical protein
MKELASRFGGIVSTALWLSLAFAAAAQSAQHSRGFTPAPLSLPAVIQICAPDCIDYALENGHYTSKKAGTQSSLTVESFTHQSVVLHFASFGDNPSIAVYRGHISDDDTHIINGTITWSSGPKAATTFSAAWRFTPYTPPVLAPAVQAQIAAAKAKAELAAKHLQVHDLLALMGAPFSPAAGQAQQQKALDSIGAIATSLTMSRPARASLNELADQCANDVTAYIAVVEAYDPWVTSQSGRILNAATISCSARKGETDSLSASRDCRSLRTSSTLSVYGTSPAETVGRALFDSREYPRDHAPQS